MKSENTQLVVCGCPRSGTSLFAKLLDSKGLETVDDSRRSEKYPNGYFEHVPLLMFHRAMERYPRDSGGTRSDYAISTDEFLQPAFLEDPFVRTMFDEAFEPLVSARVDFIKYPQFALSPLFVLDQFPHVHLVCLWRNPQSTIRSMIQKEFPVEIVPFRGIRAVLLWCMYARNIVRAKTTHSSRVTVLNIDNVVQDQEEVVQLVESVRPSLLKRDSDASIDQSRWQSKETVFTRLFVNILWRTARLIFRVKRKQLVEFVDVAMWQQKLENSTGIIVQADSEG